MLREKVIENLKKHEINMDFWFYCSGSPLCEVNLCNTSCCFAGHILFAKDIPLVKVGDFETDVRLINWSAVEEKWIDYEVDTFYFGDLTIRKSVLIPALARQLWAEEYGDEAAKALPFYELEDEDGNVLRAYEIASKHIIEYLELEHDKQGRGKISW